jgi:hypothetical protein
MINDDKLLNIGFGLKIVGLSVLISLIFGFISFSNDDGLTSSGFYLIWPILFGIFTLILFLATRFISKQLGFVVAIIFSLTNLCFNLLLLILTLKL